MRHVLACMLVAACGGSDAPNPDAPPNQPGSVSIRVTDRAVAQSNVEVIFQDADSTVKSVSTTDLDGVATAEIDGGFVTVVEPGAGRQTLTTFTGVAANDVLHLDLAEQPAEPPAVAVMMQVELDAGATTTVVNTSCGPAFGFGVTQPEQVTLFGCGDEADMLAISADETETVKRSRFHRAQRLDQTVTLTGAYTDLLSPLVTYSNLPADVTFVGAYRRYLTSRGMVFDASVGAERAGATASAVLQMPAITPAAGDVVLTSSAVYPAPEAIGQQVVIEWSAAAGNDRDYSLDVGGAVIAELSAAPVFDVATRSASWSEGAGQAPNFTRVLLAVSRDDIPVARSWAWRIAGAHAGSAIEFPQLPRSRDGFDFNVLDGDAVSVSTLTTAKLPAGYAELATRAHAFGDVKTQIAGDSGQLVIQDLADRL